MRKDDLNGLNEDWLRLRVKGEAGAIHRDVVDIGGYSIKFYCDYATHNDGTIKQGYTEVFFRFNDGMPMEEKRRLWKQVKTYIRSKVR